MTFSPARESHQRVRIGGEPPMYPRLSWGATFCSRRQGTTAWAVSLTGSALVPCGFRQATAPNGTPGWAMGGGLPPPGLYRTRRLSWASGYFYLSTDQRQRNVGAGSVRLTPRRKERDAPRLRRGDTQGGIRPPWEILWLLSHRGESNPSGASRGVGGGIPKNLKPLRPAPSPPGPPSPAWPGPWRWPA